MPIWSAITKALFLQCRDIFGRILANDVQKSKLVFTHPPITQKQKNKQNNSKVTKKTLVKEESSPQNLERKPAWLVVPSSLRGSYSSTQLN